MKKIGFLKCISLVTVLAMIVCIFPLSAFAARTLPAYATLEIPIIKNVVSESGISPETEFFFDTDLDGLKRVCSVKTNSVMTSGDGTYSCTLTIEFATENAFQAAKEFKLFERNDEQPWWSYDDTVYLVEITGLNGRNAEAVYYTYVDGEKDEIVENPVFLNTFDNGRRPVEALDNTAETFVIDIPIEKTVVTSGNTTAPDETFTFEIFDFFADADFDILVDSVDTEGDGTYSGTFSIKVNDLSEFYNLTEGFYIRENDDGEPGWTYDSSVWFVRPYFDRDNEIALFIAPADNTTDYGDFDDSVDSEYDAVEFTNEYYSDTSDILKNNVPEYKLTYDPNGGTVYEPVETYKALTEVELTKVPSRDGHTFTGWYKDKELSQKVTDVLMTNDLTVYAGWTVTPVSETLNSDDHITYVIGYEDGTVRPENNITRAEVSMIFYRLLNPDVRNAYFTSENNFVDVPENEWYNQAISTMASLGILKGRTPTTFEPDADITRAEYAAICARFDKSVPVGKNSFSDISGHWAEAEINRAVILGWIKGYEDNTFRPDNDITRAEAMTLTNRVLQRIPGNESDLLDGMTTFPDNNVSDWYYLAVQEASNAHECIRKENGYEKWVALK